MATTSKAQFLNEVFTLLKRRYKLKPGPDAPGLSVLEAVLYGICRENATRDQANQVLSRFKDEFFDWNELRVSGVEEIREALAGIPGAEDRAQRIRQFLQQLYSRTYGFNLDPLLKKPLKEALKALQVYSVFSSDYVLATVVQQALGGHAIPVDHNAQRALRRLGIDEEDISVLRGVVERAIPKNRGAEFQDLLEELGHDTCVEGEPDCPRCELRKICPFAQARKQEAAAAGRSARAQSHASTQAIKTSKPETAKTPKAGPAKALKRPADAKLSKPQPQNPSQPQLANLAKAQAPKAPTPKATPSKDTKSTHAGERPSTHAPKPKPPAPRPAGRKEAPPRAPKNITPASNPSRPKRDRGG